MKKKILILFSVLFIIIFSIILLKSNDNRFSVTYTYSPDPYSMMSSDFNAADNETKFYISAMQSSDGAVVAKFISFNKENDLYVWKFEKTEDVYGNIPDTLIKVVDIASYYENKNNEAVLSATAFKPGKEYLLFLVRDDSLFLNEVQYGLLGDAFIPMDNLNSSKWLFGTISFNKNVSKDDVIQYYKNLASNKRYSVNQFETKKILNKGIKEVIFESELVFRINVKTKVLDGRLVPQSTYEVEIQEILKGKEYVDTKSTAYLINTSKNSLTNGKEYLICLSLNTNEELHSSFTQSALNGIIPIEDKETVAQVYEWLGLKEPVTE